MKFILALLAILVMGFIFLVAIGLTLLNGILRFLGLSPKNNPFLNSSGPGTSSRSRTNSGSSTNPKSTGTQGASQPRFSDSEGEYIDFEEV